MRSWDGRLTTDSAAASIVTQTRKALWSLMLEPKLGKDATEYHWLDKQLCRRRNRDARQAEWLPNNDKQLGRAADCCRA